MKKSILVVEDDKAIRNLITTTLETQGYGFHVADTGQKAILEAVSYQPDIIILDLGLPDMDGVEIITKVRSWSNNPIIVVSARSEDKDKIKALDAGADDYLTKPFSIDELLARIRVAFRKMNYDNSSAKEEPVFVNGGLKIDYSANTVYVDEEEVHLTPMEYRLLCLLAKNVGKVLTHNYILDKIWVNVLVDRDTQSLRVFMATLRKKIEKDPSEPKYIQTHIGVGYRLIRIADSGENE
ncbi:response regulator transcription factor [Cellulosilyticum sp. ST5]|uniref:response regulator n=1 Tax=unclassified Cellulosilyticum TaxID=2643091 RepID=UPI000F8EA09A|nr:response regulator transcription factor [Cellulosilyticum sp. WCF-2]QEH67829.1 response regulator transcription factor [Cellulosilyticum sp. WCF-2]